MLNLWFIVYRILRLLDFRELDGIRMRHWRNIFIMEDCLIWLHLPMEGEPVVMEYLRSIYSTIILKDVIQREKENIRNTVFLEQLVSFLAGNIGNLFFQQEY